MLINSTGYFLLVWAILVAWIAAVAVTLGLALLRREWPWLALGVALLAGGAAAREIFLVLAA